MQLQAQTVSNHEPRTGPFKGFIFVSHGDVLALYVKYVFITNEIVLVNHFTSTGESMPALKIENEPQPPYMSAVLVMVCVLGFIALCLLAGSMTRIYSVAPDQVFFVLWEKMKSSALAGAIVACATAILLSKYPTVRIKIPLLVFLYFTLLLPVTAYIAWMVWRGFQYFASWSRYHLKQNSESYDSEFYYFDIAAIVSSRDRALRRYESVPQSLERGKQESWHPCSHAELWQ